LTEEQRRLALALARSLAAEESTVTLAELWPAFELANKGRLKTWRDHWQRWRDHVRPAFGARCAAEIGPADVDLYRAARLTLGAALATTNREIALLRRLLRFSARRGTIPESRLHGQGMTAELIWKEENVRQTVVEDSRAARITLPELLAAAGDELRAMILLLHRSGMRRTEASLLREDCIDRMHGVALVYDDMTKGGESGRYVPLYPEVLAALDALPRYDGCLFVFASSRRVRRNGALVRAAYHPDVWTHRFGRLVRKLGIDGPDGPPWLHDLRRSFITLSRRRGEDTTAIMKISGHVTDIAFRRYNIFSLTDILATKERLQRAREEEARREAHRTGPRREKSRGIEK
jgi:integrase